MRSERYHESALFKWKESESGSRELKIGGVRDKTGNYGRKGGRGICSEAYYEKKKKQQRENTQGNVWKLLGGKERRERERRRL